MYNSKYKDSYLKAATKYAKTKKGKQTRKKHQQSEKGKLTSQKGQRKYRQTENGKLKHLQSNTKRKRNLDWILLYENPLGDSEIVDWHHITDAYVVALPRDLHQVYGGKQHREKTITIINQIYGGIE